NREYNSPDAAPGNDTIRIKKATMSPQFLDNTNTIDVRTPLNIAFEFWYTPTVKMELGVSIALYTIMGECVFDVDSLSHEFENGIVKGQCTIPGNFLNNGSYYITLEFVKNASDVVFEFEECLSFDVEDYRENTAWYGEWPGVVRPKFKVDIQQGQLI
ncbi:MAG: transporter related, partial [Mucilaginibacter sp.]|nr:transporter related [Mucilaginibacter sp.]